jgi:hypothetical protein
MTHRIHEVADYDYSIDAGLGAPGRLCLWHRDGRQVAELGFVEDDGAVPSPRIAPDLSSASGFLKSSALAAVLDMLRHESLVYVTLDNRPPGFVLVHTRKRGARAKGIRK